MSETLHNERAGAVVETATGPEDAKAISPATLDTVDIKLPPYETPPTDGTIASGADLLDRALALCSAS